MRHLKEVNEHLEYVHKFNKDKRDKRSQEASKKKIIQVQSQSTKLKQKLVKKD